MLSRVAAACQKDRSFKKRSAAQYKETLQRLDEVFEYIESHYQDVLTMEETAKHVGFSPHYFTRFFKTNTGKQKHSCSF